ncbi:MAG: plasmid mobilization relaxosome protein MobC [Firmicutes bacterium HGW-Firmicutes-4]|jgi:hypothetical protein|nr:MAG: plasmid mobilization relaxosome protein MobC [Firmicutes bacterium HGW-Firmicutes-4]
MARERNKQILIRVTEKEKAIISKYAKKSNLNVNNFLIKAGTMKEIHVIEGLPEMTIEIIRIGNNINQITKAVHQGKTECGYELHEVKEELRKIWLLLKRLTQEQA